MPKFFYNDDIAKLILRLMLATFLLGHGITKLLNWKATIAWMGKALAAHSMPELLAYGVLIGEVIAPIMLIFGLHSRIAGAIVTVNMLVAFYLMHMNELFAFKSAVWALELQGFFLFTSVAIVFLGSGKYALKKYS